MPELDFCLLEEEELAVVRFVLSKGAWFVPDLKYEQPEMLRITTLEDYRETRKRTRYYFILRNDYLRSPLRLRTVEREQGRFHYVEQQVGGPTIDLLGSGIFEKEGIRSLIAGSISHYASYWDSRTARAERPPKGLKALYAEIAKQIKLSCSPIRGKSRKYWIGRLAGKDVASGVLRLPFDPATTTRP